MAEQSLREALSLNFDNAEDETPPPAGASSGGEGGLEPPGQGEPPGSASPPVGDKPGGEGTPPGVGEPPKTPEGAAPPGTEVPGEKPPAAGAPPAGTPPTPPAGGIKPPQSWRPEVREHWGKLPPEVQQEVVRRETQVMRALNEASRYVQHYNQFQDLCSPYSSMIAMDGGNPLNTFKEYLQTAAVLRMGAPQEKATAIANAILQFGVDFEQLDNALAERVKGGGRPAPGNGANGHQPQFRDPRVDNLLGTMEMRRREQEEALTRRQQSEIDAFTSDPANEFFRDVQPMVADILEVYANQGIKCSLKDAYDKACLLHPTISKVVQARATAAAAAGLVKKNQAEMDAKRRAASNPPGAPNIAPGDNTGLTLRDSIAAAVSQVESRA